MPLSAPSRRQLLPQPKSEERKKRWSSVLANLFPAGNASRRSAMLRACLDALGDAEDLLPQIMRHAGFFKVVVRLMADLQHMCGFMKVYVFDTKHLFFIVKHAHAIQLDQS